MKKILLVLAVIISSCLTACGQPQQKKTDSEMDKKTIVVYFSATGTTKKVADKIASATGCKAFAIEPEKPYTSVDLDWNDKQSRSSIEMADASSRPAIRKSDVDFNAYDIVFLGYPIWWDMAPRVINTFIENNNLKGKTVIPFATSGGSGIGNSVSILRKSYPNINWTDGGLLNQASDKLIHDWLSSF